MPESADPVPQPSFTSSTYRAIAANTPLIPVSDRPLSEQPDIQAFLNSSNRGPVSEILLYRLLSIAELYLEQKFPQKQLSGLCLGYFLDSENEPAFYYVSWGWTFHYESNIKEIERQSFENEDASVLETEDGEEKDINIEINKLAGLIEEELNCKHEENLVHAHQIKVLILVNFSPAERVSENLFPENMGSNLNQFSVPLSSENDLSFDENERVSISLNRGIRLNPNVLMSINREQLSFGLPGLLLKSSTVCVVGHKHSNDGNCYEDNPKHPRCKLVS